MTSSWRLSASGATVPESQAIVLGQLVAGSWRLCHDPEGGDNQLSLEPSSQRNDVLFDGTMVQAISPWQTGMSYLTPADSRWFSYDPPAFLQGQDAVEQYFRQCTEITSLELARSNFYTETHELYMDRGCFGTGVLFCEEGRRSRLHFRKFDVGTFCIAEDDEGYVDTLSREFKLTARQAVQWFGYPNVSEVIQKAFNSKTATELERTSPSFQDLPREADQIEIGKRTNQHADCQHLYRAGQKAHCPQIGHTGQPFFATRYLRWYNEHAYGWSPADCRCPPIKFPPETARCLAELVGIPRFLVPDTHEGECDYRASSVT